MSTVRKNNDTNLPDGWRMVRLDAIAQAIMGQSPPGHTVAELGESPEPMTGLPFIQGNAEFGRKFPTPSKWCVKPQKVAEADDVLFSVRAPVGDVNRADRSLAIGRGVAAIRFTGADSAFGWHSINHSRNRFERVAQGSTFEAIGGTEIRALPIFLPPLPEQCAIADVLDSIDEAIERTEAVIAATETLRDSLLHELLTRGVPGWHTEWKDMPGIGTIPADWEVVRLGEVIPKFDYGTSVQCNSDPTGVLVLRIPNIASGELDLSELKYATLTTAEMKKLRLATGDILLVRTNGNPQICGQTWVTDNLEGDWAFASYLVRGRPDQSRVNPAFAGHFMRSEAGRRLLRGHIRTSAGNYNLSVGDLGAMLFPCPPLDEQVCIVDSVSSNTELIDDLRIELGRLNSTQNATADALLSGKVRITN